MVLYKTYKTGIMYKAESVYATPVTVDAALKGKVKAFTSEWRNNFFKEQGAGEGRNVTWFGYGPFDVGGTIEWNVAKLDILQHCIGAISGDGTSGTPYILTEGDNVGFTGNDIKSFTMQCFSDESSDEVDTYTGCLINNVTISAEEGGLLKASADWVGKTLATNTSGVTYVPSTDDLWNFAQGVVKWGATPSEVAKVQSFGITIANNLHIYRALGDRFIQQPEAGMRRYEFTLTLKADSAILSTLKEDFLGISSPTAPDDAQTNPSPPSSLEIMLYFEGPTNQYLWIQLDEAVIESWSKPVNLEEGLINVTITGFAKEGLSNIPVKWQTSA